MLLNSQPDGYDMKRLLGDIKYMLYECFTTLSALKDFCYTHNLREYMRNPIHSVLDSVELSVNVQVSIHYIAVARDLYIIVLWIFSFTNILIMCRKSLAFFYLLNMQSLWFVVQIDDTNIFHEFIFIYVSSAKIYLFRDNLKVNRNIINLQHLLACMYIGLYIKKKIIIILPSGQTGVWLSFSCCYRSLCIHIFLLVNVQVQFSIMQSLWA